jgi:hypothetical protein
MFFAMQETWRWRKAAGDRWHYPFWAQTVRWMARKRFAEGDARARLSLDRTECAVGENVEVEAFVLNEDGDPLEGAAVRVQLTHEDGATRIAALEPAPGGWGMYRGLIAPKQPGRIALRPIVSAYGPDPLPSDATLQVRRLDLEKHALAQNRAALTAVAEASGGAYVPFHEIDRLPELLAAQIATRTLTREDAPCREPITYAAMALAFAAAWLLRKRGGLA